MRVDERSGRTGRGPGAGLVTGGFGSSTPVRELGQRTVPFGPFHLLVRLHAEVPAQLDEVESPFVAETPAFNLLGCGGHLLSVVTGLRGRR